MARWWILWIGYVWKKKKNQRALIPKKLSYWYIWKDQIKKRKQRDIMANFSHLKMIALKLEEELNPKKIYLLKIWSHLYVLAFISLKDLESTSAWCPVYSLLVKIPKVRGWIWQKHLIQAVGVILLSAITSLCRLEVFLCNVLYRCILDCHQGIQASWKEENKISHCSFLYNPRAIDYWSFPFLG